MSFGIEWRSISFSFTNPTLTQDSYTALSIPLSCIYSFKCLNLLSYLPAITPNIASITCSEFLIWNGTLVLWPSIVIVIGALKNGLNCLKRTWKSFIVYLPSMIFWYAVSASLVQFSLSIIIMMSLYDSSVLYAAASVTFIFLNISDIFDISCLASSIYSFFWSSVSVLSLFILLILRFNSLSNIDWIIFTCFPSLSFIESNSDGSLRSFIITTFSYFLPIFSISPLPLIYLANISILLYGDW